VLHDVSVLRVIPVDAFNGHQEFIDVLLHLVFMEDSGYSGVLKELVRFKVLFHATRQTVQSGNFPESFD